MTRLLVFNLAMDLDDPVLGFAHRWVEALAERWDAVEVVTMRAGRLALPPHVRVSSVGRELGWSEPRRALRFYALMTAILRHRRPDACFSHMMPLFSLMGGPLLRMAGIPLVTWYAHPKDHAVLRAAHRVSSRMVTSLPSAYPGRHDAKVLVIGQGIDLTRFGREAAPREAPPLLLCAGRLSPVKDHPTFLRALARLAAAGVPFRGAILGQPQQGQETYAASLPTLATSLGLGERVAFVGQVPQDALPAWYRRATAHVNLTPAGFGDKVAWEAMACGTPSLVANVEMTETLGDDAAALLFPPGDDAALAERLTALLERTPEEREAVGARLRDGVARLHSLPALADRITAICRELSEPRR